MASQQCILVVDDSLLARMMLKKIVAKIRPNAEIFEGKDGADALAKITGQCIHIALVDYNMPGMNGLELARILIQQYPGISIALVTANIQDYIAKEALDIGIRFIQKPLEQEKIEHFIDAEGK